MVVTTGGEGGASCGGIRRQSLTSQLPPRPPPVCSTSQSSGPTTSRLFALFEECVNHGVRAKLETYRQQGVICVDFSCHILAGEPAERANNRMSKRRQWNRERTKKWRKEKKQRTAPLSSTPAAPMAVNGTAAARSFAEVVAQPASVEKVDTIATSQAVRTAETAATGQRLQKAMQPNPKKVAKTALAASRVSQRAALLLKKRAAAVVETPAATTSAAVDNEATPEILRGTKGVSRLRSLDISLDASPQPPPSPPTVKEMSPKIKTKLCTCTDTADCTVECEEDYFDEKYEDGGYRLNTQKPGWWWVFPCRKGICRFCKTSLDEEDEEGENCVECGDTTVFQLVLKYAPRWQYYNR